MKKSFENKYNTSKVVQAFMEEQSAATINASPGLAVDVVNLTETNTEIGNLNEFQTINRSGHRIVKENFKEIMISSAMDCVNALMAFAETSYNEVLFNEVKTTRTYLQKMRDNEVKDRCAFIHFRANEYQANIETYGITVAVVSKFEEQITDFNANISKPRLSIADRVLLTKKLNTEFKKLNALLKNMDIKVNALNLLFPDFVSEYKTCRIIVNHRGSSLAISGTIKDHAGMPISGAMFTIESLKREAKSTLKGNFEFKNIATGEYFLKIVRPGYTTITQKVNIVKGETTKLFIVMNTDASQLRVA